jgi:ribonuclease HI
MQGRAVLSLDEVVIYTDGGCEPNPGPGGYGVVLLWGEHRKELSGGYRKTTNNRMEMMAAITGLEALRGKRAVTVFTDSRYLADAVTKGWAARWRRRGWMRTATEPALNPDLWARLLVLCEQHKVKFRWVRGHAGNRENERCDELAGVALKQSDLPPDDGYENSKGKRPDKPRGAGDEGDLFGFGGWD